MLYLDADSPIRLKSFSSSSRGAKATIRIELETEDMTDLGYFIASLGRTQQAQRVPKPKPEARLALPKPGDI